MKFKSTLGDTVAVIEIQGVDAVQADSTGLLGSSLKNASVPASKLDGGQSGNAPVYGARAWCVFNGNLVGTNAPLAGGNIASVTRNTTGEYTVTFVTAMPNANYAVVPMPSSDGALPIGGGMSLHGIAVYAKTTTSFKVQTVFYNGPGATMTQSDLSATRAALAVFI